MATIHATIRGSKCPTESEAYAATDFTTDSTTVSSTYESTIEETNWPSFISAKWYPNFISE